MNLLRPLMLGGGLQNGHTHMATVAYPVLKDDGNNADCQACIAVDAFINSLPEQGYEICRAVVDSEQKRFEEYPDAPLCKECGERHHKRPEWFGK